jgi:hypothetical protein
MATPIPPLLPACVDGSLNGKFDPIAAVSYDPSSWEYYKVSARWPALGQG